MITAGVSSGKTFAFLLPTLTLVVYRAPVWPRAAQPGAYHLPRSSLVEDQYHGLRELLGQINAQLALHRPGASVADRPALDAGQMLAQSLDMDATSLAETLPAVAQQGIEIILTTPESLKNRMLDPRAVSISATSRLLSSMRSTSWRGSLAAMGSTSSGGCDNSCVTFTRIPQFEPSWVGASATVAEPVEHCARVLSLDQARVVHVAPTPSELVRFGTFHHVFLHTRVGKPSISAVTNGVACLVHTRNDCTAFNHYVDPAANPLQVRPSEEDSEDARVRGLIEHDRASQVHHSR